MVGGFQKMLRFLFFLFLGIFVGIFTGLIPGLHVNLVALTLVYYSDYLKNLFSVTELGVFIISVAVTHTFLDNIPGIYLGANEDNILNVLPGHRMLMDGRGYDAVRYTLIGSFFSLFLCLVFVPLFIFILPYFYDWLKNWIGYLVLGVMVFLIVRSKSVVRVIFIFLMSGLLGYIVLELMNFDDGIFPMLSGLFGFSGMIGSLMNKVFVPEQIIDSDFEIDNVSEIVCATILGFFAAFLPGIGSSQVAIIGQQFLNDLDDRGFLVLIGGINTVNLIFSLVTLYVLNKARNGAVLAIQQLGGFNFEIMVLLLICGFIAGCVSLIVGILISRVFSKFISKIDYQKLVLCVLGFVTCMVYYFTGFLGLFILFVAMCIGIVCGYLEIGKHYCMGCLILPVIIFFL